MSYALVGLCAFAAYLLFAGSLSISETTTGLALALACSLSVAAYANISDRRFRFSLGHARPWGRALRRLPAATLRAGFALANSLRLGAADPSRADEAPFRHGPRDAPSERARRAAAVLAASLAPNSFVLRTEPGSASALIHSIDRQPPPANPEGLA